MTRIQHLCFLGFDILVTSGVYYKAKNVSEFIRPLHSKRLCRLISGLCRHMSISAVSRHLGIRWETIKNIDKCYLQETLPALDPSTLTDLKYIGVDEVARAKGHDYMTLVYDMLEGHLIWVGTGPYC